MCVSADTPLLFLLARTQTHTHGYFGSLLEMHSAPFATDGAFNKQGKAILCQALVEL